jgi:hypothetical protein
MESRTHDSGFSNSNPIAEMNDSREQRRDYYRLEYPAAERPTLRFKGGDYTVSEVSAGGLRLLAGRPAGFRVGQFFAGVLRFVDGGISPVVGAVHRFDGTDVVVKLTIGIRPSRMMAEQLRIRRKYPMYFETP